MPHRYDSTRAARARRSLNDPDQRTFDVFDIPLEEKALFLQELNEKYNLKRNRSLAGSMFGAMSALAFAGAVIFAIRLVTDRVEEIEDEAEGFDVLDEEKSWWQRFFDDEDEQETPRMSTESTTVPGEAPRGASESEGKPTTKSPKDTRAPSSKMRQPGPPSEIVATAKQWQKTGSYGKAARGLPAAIEYASKETGVDASVLYTFAFKETRFGKIMNNKTSSAQGVFQFMPVTWKEIEAKHGKRYPILRKGPRNLQAAALGAALMIRQLARTYRRHFASPPSTTDLYMMYLLGPTGGLRFLKAMEDNPNVPASSVFPREARSNPSVFNTRKGPRSLIQVYRYMHGEIGEVEEALRHTNRVAPAPVTDSEGMQKDRSVSITPIQEPVPDVSSDSYREDTSPVGSVAFNRIVDESMIEAGATPPSEGDAATHRPQEFIDHDGVIVAVS